MKILPHHYYTVTMRSGEYQRVGRCFNLSIQQLSPEQLKSQEVPQPTHILTFRDTQGIRIYTGRIKEQQENKLIFILAEGKEYEFRPI
ncbi:MAG TPA: hypothetical protein EYP71_05150 [Dehalococcoidia bacterium]|nr:hypothetical protein [Dehalococcoidia bacterium]